jgi:hypothetical protein
MKQTLAYLENGHFTYETKIADDLREAIKQQEEASAKIRIMMEAYTAISPANLGQVIKQKEQQPVPVKTYSGGKAWPVQTEWVGLTDDEIKYFQMTKNVYPGITKEIEAKLKEKNSKG